MLGFNIGISIGWKVNVAKGSDVTGDLIDGAIDQISKNPVHYRFILIGNPQQRDVCVWYVELLWITRRAQL